jgi:DNA-binding NtrC family response regulator
MSETITILVVDDEENVLLSVQKVILSKYPDYKIDLVNSPAQALEKIKASRYNLVITDLMMPGIDGLELIKKIRTTAPDLKIMMITGYATMKTALLAMREGASKYISKPFTRDELLQAINAVLLQEPQDSGK